MIKKIACAAIALTLAMGISTTAYAVSLSGTLNTKKTMVTTKFNSGTSGYHIVKVAGWEYHSDFNTYYYYSKNHSVTGGGNLATMHLTDGGCVFKKYFNGRYLTSTLYHSSSPIGVVRVN